MLNSIFKKDLFKGKKALITGGGTGIGLRIARELAVLGAEEVIASRKLENLEKSGFCILFVQILIQPGQKLFYQGV